MPTTAATQFHWIHKTSQSSSLSNTDGVESQEIRRFVQHQQLSQRRRGAIQIRWSKNHKRQISGNSSPGTEKVVEKSVIKDSPLKHAVSNTLCAVASINSTSDNVDLPESNVNKSRDHDGFRRPHRTKHRHFTQHRWRVHFDASVQNNWSPSVRDASLKSPDPFDATCVPMSEDTSTLMKYYAAAQSGGGNAYKLHTLPKYLQSVVKIDQIIKLALSNYLCFQHCMYAMMAFTAARLLVITKVRLNSVKSPEFYMQKAITSLRQRLLAPGDEVDHATIGAMNQIALADWTSGNLAAARIHLEVLSRLIPNIDAGQDAERFTIEGIRTLDLQTALETGEIPFLPATSSFEPLSRGRLVNIKYALKDAISQEAATGKSGIDDIVTRLGHDPLAPHDILDDCAITLDLRMGRQLEEVLSTDILHPAIHPTIRNILDCLTLAKYVWRTTAATPKDARWMCRTARTMVHHLWTYKWDHAHDFNDARYQLTDCVRLTLLVLLTLATNRMAPRAVAVLSKDLYTACRHFHSHYHFPNNSVTDLQKRTYLWTILTSVFASKDGSHEKRWLLHEAAAIASQLGLRSYEALHDAMTGFIYSWTMQMQSLQDVVGVIDVELKEAKSAGSGYQDHVGEPWLPIMD